MLFWDIYNRKYRRITNKACAAPIFLWTCQPLCKVWFVVVWRWEHQETELHVQVKTMRCWIVLLLALGDSGLDIVEDEKQQNCVCVLQWNDLQHVADVFHVFLHLAL
jgi:hypothetical protein